MTGNSTEIRIAVDLYRVANEKVSHQKMVNAAFEWNNTHKPTTAPRMVPEMVEFIVRRLFPKYPPTVSYYRTVGEGED